MIDVFPPPSTVLANGYSSHDLPTGARPRPDNANLRWLFRKSSVPNPRRRRGGKVIDCDAELVRGQEFGYFEAGSTMIVLAPPAFQLAPGVARGVTLRVGQPLLRRTLSLQMHEALRQRVSTHYHLEGLTREELDAYLGQQLKAAGVTQPLFDDTARQGLYQATKGIPRKINKLALTALRLAAARKADKVNEALLLDATSEALL